MAWGINSIGAYTTLYETPIDELGYVYTRSGSWTAYSTTDYDVNSIGGDFAGQTVKQAYTHYDYINLDGNQLFGGQTTTLYDGSVIRPQFVAATQSLKDAVSTGLWAVSSNDYFTNNTNYSVYFPFYNTITGVTSSIAKITDVTFQGAGEGYVTFEFENGNARHATISDGYLPSDLGPRSAIHRTIFLVGNTSSLDGNTLGYDFTSDLESAITQYEASASSGVSVSSGGALSPNSLISTNPSLGIGNTYNFNHSQSIQIKHREHFNVLNKNDDWAVSFWAIIPPSQSLAGRQQQSLVQKRNTYTYIDDAGLEQVKSQGNGQYPFDISFYTELHPTSPGHIFIKASDGNSVLNFSSSNAYSDGLAHEYVLNKTNSEIALWVDGTKEVSASYSFKGVVTNDRDILIGARSISETNGFFSGSMSQFRIHRNSLSSAMISSLADNSTSGSALQRKEVGYVFYKHGMIIISDPRFRYQNILLGNGNWNYTNRNFQLDYRATKQVEEFSILCEIKRDEYNVSSNPSLRIDGTDTDTRLMNMVTGSDFRPYITQIGLYNDNGDLLAIGKLGSPLKKRQDVDVTINVKFDID